MDTTAARPRRFELIEMMELPFLGDVATVRSASESSQRIASRKSTTTCAR